MKFFMKHLNLACIFFSLIFPALSPAEAEVDNSYSNSYFGRQMPEETYHLYRSVLRQIMRQEHDIDTARMHGEAFFDYLATHENPDFASFAAGDVNINPVGVIWSQLELARQGTTNNLRVPEDFRKLYLSIQIWNGRPDSEFNPELRYRMYFDAFRQLKASSFLVTNTDPKTYSIFFHSLFAQLDKQIEVENPAAKSFMSDWAQAKIDISRWDWDPELQETLIKQHNVPDYYFPAFLKFNPMMAALQERLEEGQTGQYDWLINELIYRIQQVGSLIGSALVICDPNGESTPSRAMVELTSQGKQRSIYLQEPFPWVDVSDYLLGTAESLLAPVAHSESEIMGSNSVAESTASDSSRAEQNAVAIALSGQDQSVTNGSAGLAITEQPVRNLARRRTITGLCDLGFPMQSTISGMTEVERASFCNSWPSKSKQVLTQFNYFLNIISLIQSKNPDYISKLWSSMIKTED